jgi:adenosylcobinamide-GDP ribazoletransferase
VPALSDHLNLFARRFALALQRATRLPPASEPAGEDPAGRSDRHLPGAGIVVGVLAAFVFAVFGLLLRGNPAGPGVAAVASLFAVLVLTGAAQERAVFRLAEAFVPGNGQGVIALVLLLAARLAAVAAIGVVSEPGVLAALLAGPVVSRFAPLLAAHWASTEASEDAATVRVAALWCLVPLALMLVAGGIAFVLLALAGAGAASVALLRFLRGRPGGFDETRAAALQQACEAAFYLAASLGA